MAKAQEYYANDIGQRIKTLRKDQNIKQDDLADSVGCSRQRIGYYENGTVIPGSDVLGSIADAFNISADDLLGRPRKGFDDETAFLLKCSEYTGLSVDAIKEFHTYPRLGDTITKLCSTYNGLLDCIGRYLFPVTGMIPPEFDVEILAQDSQMGFRPIFGISDIDNDPVLFLSNQGEFYLDRDAIEQMLIIQIVDILKRIKRGEVKKR